MNSLYASLSLILAEVILFLLITCGTLIVLKVKEQRKDKKALLALTEKIKENEEDRLNVLSIKLKESHELDSDALSAAAKQIRDTEIEFYITMMNIYADRDSEALKNLDKNIAALTESNTKLGTISIDSSATVTNAPPEEELNTLKNENSHLQHELSTSQQINERLEKELDTAKKEMRETVAEFVSAFNGGRDAAEEKLAKKEKENAEAKAKAQEEASELPNEPPATTINVANHAEELAVKAPADEVSTPVDKTIDETPDIPESNDTAPTDKDETKEVAGNPFLSIDSDAIASNDTESPESSVDHTTDENDLDTDLNLNIDPTPQPSIEMSDKTDAPAVDDIDAVLAANTDDTPPTSETKGSDKELNPADIDTLLATSTDEAPADTSNAKGSDEDFDPDDIDALLAASADEASEKSASDADKDSIEKAVDTDDIDALLTANTATKEPSQAPSSEEALNIDADDIDAILEDIDITTASPVPNDKKEVETAS